MLGWISELLKNTVKHGGNLYVAGCFDIEKLSVFTNDAFVSLRKKTDFSTHSIHRFVFVMQTNCNSCPIGTLFLLIILPKLLLHSFKYCIFTYTLLREMRKLRNALLFTGDAEISRRRPRLLPVQSLPLHRT